jgi:hypothetical protein
MALECSSSFAISFSASLIDASITLTSVAVTVDPDDEDISHWLVHFLYVAGIPAATAFRLNSADSLTGTFTPSEPEGIGSGVKNAVLEGTVQLIPGVDVEYEGTITVIQV